MPRVNAATLSVVENALKKSEAEVSGTLLSLSAERTYPLQARHFV